MKLAAILLALAILAPLPAVALAPVALAAAGAVTWFAVDCLRWPAVTTPLDDWSGAFA